MQETITILITGAGAPGIQGTIYSLRENYDNRSFHIIGTDVCEQVVGKYLCDEFYTIAPARDTEQYLYDLQTLCRKSNISIILPQNTAELSILSGEKNRFFALGVQIIVSDHQSIELANNKYKLFQSALKNNIPIASHALVSCFDQLKKEALKIGWPDKAVVVKPPTSNGSRGVRVIIEKLDRKKAFYTEKPSSLYISLDELHAILGDNFPELIVMEYLPGDEYTVDVFRNADSFIAIPRKREIIRSGITFAATLKQDEWLIDCSKKLADAVGLTFCFGFQYKINEQGTPLLLESNPRVQGTMVMSALAGANIIYSSVKALLGEDIPEMTVDWNTQLLRYWGAIGIKKDGYTRI